MAAKMTCTVCRRANSPWRKFCGGCGTGFLGACKCGFCNTAEDRFCGGCGIGVRNTIRVKQFASVENITTKIAIDELLPYHADK